MKSQFLFILMCVLFFADLSFGQVRLAFFELRTPEGRLVQLEKNGRFGHVALQHQGKWLHAHPYRGVEWVALEKVREVGTLVSVIEFPNLAAPEETRIHQYLGRPFDRGYTWDDERLYCSELIAKLLNISPLPMEFDPELWPKAYEKLRGQPGLSPDDIYRILTNQEGYQTINSCQSITGR